MDRQPSRSRSSPTDFTIRGLTSSWSRSSTSTTQTDSASPIWGAASPTPGASRIVWVRSSSSPWRNRPKLSTGSPLIRRRGSPSRTMGRTLTPRVYLVVSAVRPKRVPSRRRDLRDAGSCRGIGVGRVGGALGLRCRDIAAQLGREVSRLLGDLLAGLAGELGGLLGNGACLVTRDRGELGGLRADLLDDRRGLRGQVLDHGLQLRQPLARLGACVTARLLGLGPGELVGAGAGLRPRGLRGRVIAHG